MPLIDSHAHLDFYSETPTERDEVLRRAYTAGVHIVLAIGIGDGPAGPGVAETRPVSAR